MSDYALVFVRIIGHIGLTDGGQSGKPDTGNTQMTYRVNTSEQISGYLDTVKAKLDTLPGEDARKFIAECVHAANARKTPDITEEAKAQLEYINQQLTEIYFRHVGWLA